MVYLSLTVFELLADSKAFPSARPTRIRWQKQLSKLSLRRAAKMVCVSSGIDVNIDLDSRPVARFDLTPLVS